MKVSQLKTLIIKDKTDRGVSDYDYAEGYVDYDTGNLLFDYGFNTPCDTYFHNEDDCADSPEGTPEASRWAARDENWEMCGRGKFINYPDNFIIRHRFARPSYIQVLEWFEERFGAEIDISSSCIKVKNLHIPAGQNSHYTETWEYVGTSATRNPILLAKTTVDMIMDRFRLLAGSIDIKSMILNNPVK